MISFAEMATKLSERMTVRLVGDLEFAANLQLQSFGTDTRALNPGDVFVALKGPNHDAHQHLDTAASMGAAALVVEHESSVELPQIVVSDTRFALGAMAAVWCQLHQARRIAITGSNGKTTVKEMVAAILKAASGKPVADQTAGGESTTASNTESAVLATRGNLNNDIGLPLTCLSIRDSHRYAVLEMGANAAGEIAYLSNIAKPDVALVNSVAEAHLAGFGSVDIVAKEKASIFSGLSADGCAVMPDVLVANPRFGTVLQEASAHCRTLSFGFSDSADIKGEHSGDSTRVSVSEKASKTASKDTGGNLAGSQFDFTLQLPGAHNHLNALAAIALCSNFDVTADDVVNGLAAMQAVAGRLQLRSGISAARVIDDTYNANPASVRVAIDVLAAYGGKRVLVLGDMKELGESEMLMHAEAGRYAREKGIDTLITIGTLAAHAAGEFGENAASFTDKREIAWLLKEQLGPDHTVLFKGSRGARMEEIITLLQELQQRKNPESSGASGITAGGIGGAAQLHSNLHEEPLTTSAEFLVKQRLSRRVVTL